LVAIHLGGDAGQPPAGPTGDRHHHLQITSQFADRGCRRIGLTLPLRFQKQLGLFQNPLPDGGRRVPPSGIQLPGLAAGEAVRAQRFG